MKHIRVFSYYSVKHRAFVHIKGMCRKEIQLKAKEDGENINLEDIHLLPFKQ